jgi:hypothetical protein
MVWEKVFNWLARKCKRTNEIGFSNLILKADWTLLKGKEIRF